MTTTTQSQAETRFVALMTELFQMDEPLYDLSVPSESSSVVSERVQYPQHGQLSVQTFAVVWRLIADAHQVAWPPLGAQLDGVTLA